ncbi:PH (Pleckstrin Homology) domain-containing protein [Palleronia aestuarii]|uniref:PH (Pleckstrin Homology) domain-containing protein n=1 Tax=Palleronia aestuarii TaxID=568105 RepID=A0A2W7NT98_9RHOB|nr:photosynthetic complex putative assembly protein PuhB [Palleronia aestuarii]PZX16546.1 PH (Pleckstrin Homology) domain-containing protein [Palleronia aestuarii]
MAHHDDPDFAVEPVPGLPEQLPRGERMLWQGRPDTWALARHAFKIRWVAGYFAVLAFARVAASAAAMGWGGALPLAVPFLVLGVVTCAILLGLAKVQSRMTLYTITTERVVMRIGAALTLTLNLPFPRIAGAEMALGPRGTGTIALSTMGDTRLSYLVLWPHARPWRFRRTEPALRSVPEAEKVAAILADAVETRMAAPQIAPRAMAMAAE